MTLVLSLSIILVKVPKKMPNVPKKLMPKVPKKCPKMPDLVWHDKIFDLMPNVFKKMPKKPEFGIKNVNMATLS